MDYDRLPTEREPPGPGLDGLSTRELVAELARGDREAIAALDAAAEAIARTIERAASAIRSGGRLIYLGAGTSGRLGVLDAAECPPTFGVAPGLVVGVIAGGPAAAFRAVEGAEDDAPAGAAALDALGLRAEDLVVGISASGSAPFVHGALARAKEVGAATALISCALPPQWRPLVDLAITFDPGPEAIAGSTRMKAGLATKAVLHAISTGTMVHLGKVYGQLMVEVVPSNRKLRRRACRIVERLTGLATAEAATLLAAADNQPKVAVVMQRCGLDREAALARLVAAEGQLRAVIGPAGPRPG